MEYSASQVAQHQSRSDLWMSIHGKVYNVSKFLDSHPGGEEVLADHAGMDATGAFDDIGHSEEAHEQMKEYLIGTLKKSTAEQLKEGVSSVVDATKHVKVHVEDSTNYLPYLVPLVAVLVYIGFKYIQ
eukprot:NODE_260_length_11481_cov_1.187928.p8 type:complete len:128 gc:universal NODE_260_length_11481_cov_1.187928:6987-7370(+)